MRFWPHYLQYISIVLALYVPVAQADTQQVETLNLVDGRMLRVLYVSPTYPTAILLMLPGGTGRVGLSLGGRLQHAHDFVIRTKDDWVSRGYAVVIADSPNDINLRGYRHTAAYTEVLKQIIVQVRQHSSRPIFLIGTSQGSIAAVNGGAHIPDVKGIVLAEPVSVMGHSGETIYSAGLDSVHAPVLVVANQKDRCWVAPPNQANAIVSAASASEDVRLLKVSGGQMRAQRGCSALSAHGYYGIESEVIEGVDHWLKQHGAL